MPTHALSLLLLFHVGHFELALLSLLLQLCEFLLRLESTLFFKFLALTARQAHLLLLLALLDPVFMLRAW